MRAVRRAIGTAFGALGIVFLLGGPPMALTRDWGALTVLLLPAIGIVMIVLAVLLARQPESPE
ncbi:MAG: hypothetical protein IIC95_00910 [Chloroflexi bacterium]|nr:hypothetical protein [Chloroflexota bacterium]MCH7654529.1 hypothetical protein [Chloroflexota bacterium]